MPLLSIFQYIAIQYSIREVILYHLWGVFQYTEFTTRITVLKRFCVYPARDIITFNYWWCHNYKTAAQQYYQVEKLSTTAQVTRLALDRYFSHMSDIDWERDFWDSVLQEPKLTGITCIIWKRYGV